MEISIFEGKWKGGEDRRKEANNGRQRVGREKSGGVNRASPPGSYKGT